MAETPAGVGAAKKAAAAVPDFAHGLVCIDPAHGYKIGDRIEDNAEIAKLMKSKHHHHFTKVAKSG